jgi:hypothetical protein
MPDAIIFDAGAERRRTRSSAGSSGDAALEHR